MYCCHARLGSGEDNSTNNKIFNKQEHKELATWILNYPVVSTITLKVSTWLRLMMQQVNSYVTLKQQILWQWVTHAHASPSLLQRLVGSAIKVSLQKVHQVFGTLWHFKSTLGLPWLLQHCWHEGRNQMWIPSRLYGMMIDCDCLCYH